MKVLMVCLGNICRSPLAEGILKAKCAEMGLDWQVDSAGTSAFHIGELPDPRSIQTAKDNGIDITDQRARQVSWDDFEKYDLILAMDSSNFRSLTSMKTSPKIKMMLSFGNGVESDVPDPYYNNGFDSVYNMLENACEGLLKTYSSSTTLA